MWYSDATHVQPMCPPAALYSGARVQATVWHSGAPPSSRTDTAPALTAAPYSDARVAAPVWHSGARVQITAHRS